MNYTLSHSLPPERPHPGLLFVSPCTAMRALVVAAFPDNRYSFRLKRMFLYVFLLVEMPIFLAIFVKKISFVSAMIINMV